MREWQWRVRARRKNEKYSRDEYEDKKKIE